MEKELPSQMYYIKKFKCFSSTEAGFSSIRCLQKTKWVPFYSKIVGVWQLFPSTISISPGSSLKLYFCKPLHRALSVCYSIFHYTKLSIYLVYVCHKTRSCWPSPDITRALLGEDVEKQQGRGYCGSNLCCIEGYRKIFVCVSNSF